VKKVFASLVIVLLITGLGPFSFMNANALPPGDTLYGGAGRGSVFEPGAIVIIDQSDGTQTLLSIPVDGISGLVFDPSGRLFGIVPTVGFSSISTLVELDPDSGNLLNTIGEVTLPGTGGLKISDLASDPITGDLVAVTAAGDLTFGNSFLFILDKNNAEATLIGDMGRGPSDVSPIAFGPDGTFYSHCRNCGNLLLIIDPTDASQIDQIPLNPSEGLDGLAVRSDGVIFGSRSGLGGPEETFTIDAATGAVTSVGPGARAIGDLAFAPFTQQVGGELLSLDTTALLVAGITTPLAWLAYAISAIGIGAFWFARNPYNVRNVKVILEDYFERFIKRE